MAAAVVVGRGPVLYLERTATPGAGGVAVDPDPERAAQRSADPRPEDVPAGLVRAVESLPPDVRLLAEDPAWGAAIASRTRRAVGAPTVLELRRARASAPYAEPATERAFLRALARRRLEQALRDPGEVLTTLAREEERVARALGREERASESLLVVPGSALADLEGTWSTARRGLFAHRDHLLELIEREARALVPNVSALVGPRVAARLVAAAGGVEELGRMRASRIQLLGSRRRPSAERGPRYGVLYVAERMADVPLGRRGAYARSLAALTAIAARADATTHRDLAARLVPRRDRRVSELQRRRR